MCLLLRKVPHLQGARFFASESAGKNLNWFRKTVVEPLKPVLATTPGKIMGGLVFLGTAGVLGVLIQNTITMLWDGWQESKQIGRMNRALSKGYCPVPEKSKNWIERNEQMAAIGSLMHPSLISTYLLITGEHGCGKSSLIQEVIQGEKSGVIYVDCEEFDSYMSKALDYKPIKGEPMPQGIDWLRLFRNCAENYSSKNPGKKATLVIDNINLLVKNKQELLLQQLQDAAKGAADSKAYHVIFVSSEGSGTEFLQKFTASSRMKTYYVPDLTESEAKELLKGFSDQQKDFIYRYVTGGRLLLLVKILGEKNPQTAISDVANDVIEKVKRLRLIAPSDEKGNLIDIFGEELLKNHVSEKMIDDILKTVPTLLSWNVFSPGERNRFDVKFQSKPVTTYFLCQTEGKKFNPDFNRLIACQ